jgi:hypothetical protein
MVNIAFFNCIRFPLVLGFDVDLHLSELVLAMGFGGRGAACGP